MTTTLTDEAGWDLGILYADEEEHRAARVTLRDRWLPEAEIYAGRLTTAAATLAAGLLACDRVSREIKRLHSWATLRSDLDVRVAAHQATRQETEALVAEVGRRLAFVRPEILAAPPPELLRFLDEDPGLADYAFFIRDLLRRRAHVLTPGEEALLADAASLARAPNALFEILHNGELPRPTVVLSTGAAVRLTPVTFSQYRSTSVRADRLDLFPAYFLAYSEFQGSLGQNLQTALRAHAFRARARGYASCLDAALDGDRIPPEVYHSLIRAAHRSLPLLHRYLRVRSTALGVDPLTYADLHCPLVQGAPQKFTTAAARRIVSRALVPLGPRYGEMLEHAFQSRWIDWHPVSGKRAGAYASGSVRDAHPFVLLNFNGDPESVMTLAHEMGHALHSHMSNRRQPFPLAGYSIFVAEVASTFNELLVLDQLVDEAEDPAARIQLLALFLDGVRATFFRQVQFAEFELAIHARVERGEALTGEALTSDYRSVLGRYYGADNGVVQIDDAYGVEWASIPHLFYDFYVYQYATGLVAASALAHDVTSAAPGARDRYLSFLESGGSDYPLNLLAAAGVDLTTDAPYDAFFALVARRIEALEIALRDLPKPATP